MTHRILLEQSVRYFSGMSDNTAKRLSAEVVQWMMNLPEEHRPSTELMTFILGSSSACAINKAMLVSAIQAYIADPPCSIDEEIPLDDMFLY